MHLSVSGVADADDTSRDDETSDDDDDEDSEADDDDNAEDQNDVDDAVRETVKSALGNAAAHSDVEVLSFICILNIVPYVID